MTSIRQAACPNSAEGNNPISAKDQRQLTPIQRRVVRYIALGYSVPQVAKIMNRSRRTVDNHKVRAMKKLGVRNAVLLAREALRQRITTLEDALSSEDRARLDTQ